MFKRWIEFLAKNRSAPEDSVTYRVSMTVLVMFALTLTLQQLEWPSYWPAVLLITPAASLLSYHRRKESNVGIKIFLSFAMVGLLLWFFTRLASTLYDPRLPLAELLIWLQTLHSFDLPAKKDLRYTGLVALILMAIACVLTYSSYFAPLLLLFCVLFLGVLVLDYWSDNRTPETKVHVRPKESLGLKPGWLLKTVGRYLPLALAGAAAIFIFMPRYQGLKLRSLPVSWDIQFSLDRISGGEIENQFLNQEGRTAGGKPQRIDGDSYFGFDSEVNLNARGQLSDRIVMKVRTSNWQYHRGVTFSQYTGYGWKGIPWEPTIKTVNDPPFYFPSVNWRNERVTIYYAETDLPNIIFTPSNPRRLYFPSNEIYYVSSFEQGVAPAEVLNNPAVLISPFFMEEGVVYSVLNQISDQNPGTLKQRLLSGESEKPAADYLQPFLQLPPTVTERTREKARKIVEGKTSRWTQAAALTSHLQQNYTYDIEVGFYPEQADTVDYFLFEEKVGYCEQFASALCVMARSVGIPARYVTGYLPGTFNPVSGFYEIKASDAHAWVEIYFEDYGWMIFDPVPGENATPQVGSEKQNQWLLEALLEYLNVPDQVRRVLPNLLRLFLGLSVASLLFALIRGSRRKKQEPSSDLAPYLTQAEKLTQPREPGETVKQWAARLSEFPSLQTLATIYEEKYYRGQPLESEDHTQLEEMLAQLKQKKN